MTVAPSPSKIIVTTKAQDAEAHLIAIDFLANKGLYSYLSLSKIVETKAVSKIREARLGRFDFYCTECRKETSFIVEPMPVKHFGGGLDKVNNDALISPPIAFTLRAVCQRDLTAYLYVFFTVDSKFYKIGQYPSMADIAFGELRGIDHSLPNTDRTELGKALGLFAHNAASGAFVYLRRVFERLIQRTHDTRAEQSGPIQGFETMRMDEKIAALRNELPERAVRNKSVFSVLSAGIHELTDDQCKSLFPVVKAVVFQILEQEEHKRKQSIAERETDAAFAALLGTGLASETGG